MAAGCILGLALLRAAGGAAGALAALAAVGAGLAVARLPVAGRPVEAWGPTVARFTAARLSEGRPPWRPPGRPARRGALSSLELGSLGGQGVVLDKRAGGLSVALRVGGDGFALADEEAQAAAIAAWAQVLSSLAARSEDLHRLQWILRTRPSGAEWLEEPSAGASLGAGYRALLASSRAELSERETLLVLTARPHRQLAAGPGRRRGEEMVAEQLFSSALALGEQLRQRGVQASGPLSREELAVFIRRAYEEPGSASLGCWPFPLGVEEHWASLRTDASWQAVYWVAEWPRSDVGPAAFLPLLLGGAPRQAVSLTLAPLPPAAASRRAERERTSGQADAELRRRHGFAVTARSRAEQEVAFSREEELAAGHGAFLFSGYVAVSASDEEELEVCCGSVEQAAALSRLELRRLYGCQEEAWTCSLPTGRGCR